MTESKKSEVATSLDGFNRPPEGKEKGREQVVEQGLLAVDSYRFGSCNYPQGEQNPMAGSGNPDARHRCQRC